jgi:hypothetical protein
MYKDQRVRKAIDECAFRYVSPGACTAPCTTIIITGHPLCPPRIYGHWVKKSNNQNRAALFENYLVRHTS